LPQIPPAPQTDGAIERSEALHDLVLRSLDDDKAVEIVSIPLQGKSNIADYMVIASGRSTRQVAAMAQKLGERIKRELGRSVRERWNHELRMNLRAARYALHADDQQHALAVAHRSKHLLEVHR